MELHIWKDIVVLFWVGLGFLLGAIPFSLWLGYLIAHKDIRQFGDKNPGAINAWRAGGWSVGMPALLLDFLKAAIPVGIAYSFSSVSGLGLFAVALAPVVGHAFSPFLGFRGGKAVAVTFGLWTGLTQWEGPMIIGLSMGILVILQKNDAWSIILAMFVFLIYLLIRQADVIIFTIWGGNALVLGWTHLHELRELPKLRKRISNTLRFPK